MGFGRGVAAALVSSLMLGGGCLSVPDADEMGSSTSGSTGTSTTGDVCVDGTRGCPCYTNDTCNQGLQCLEGVACFPADCVAGTQLCPCLDAGGCDVGLVCNDGVCRTDNPGTTGGATSPATSTAGDPGSTGSIVQPCDGLPGDAFCTGCAKANCCVEYEDCASDVECIGMLECVSSDTYSRCLTEYSVPRGGRFDALVQCLEVTAGNNECFSCLPASSQCGLPDMGQGGVDAKYTVCYECASESCCAELNSCLDDELCSCTVDCVLDPNNADAPDQCNELCGGSSGLYDELSSCATDACASGNGETASPVCLPGL